MDGPYVDCCEHKCANIYLNLHFQFFGSIPRTGVAGPCGNSMFNSLSQKEHALLAGTLFGHVLDAPLSFLEGWCNGRCFSSHLKHEGWIPPARSVEQQDRRSSNARLSAGASE